MSTKWTEAMEFAERAAGFSLDASKQNGAVLAYDDGRVLSLTAAWNQFPMGVQMTEERWERPLKYRYVEHAERNAVYAAAAMGFPTLGMTLVCPWAACTDCARAIIQSRIVRLVTRERIPNERWDEEIAIADEMLAEAGVELVLLPTSDTLEGE